MNEFDQARAEAWLLKVYEKIGRKEAAAACGVTVNATYKWEMPGKRRSSRGPRSSPRGNGFGGLTSISANMPRESDR